MGWVYCVFKGMPKRRENANSLGFFLVTIINAKPMDGYKSNQVWGTRQKIGIGNTYIDQGFLRSEFRQNGIHMTVECGILFTQVVRIIPTIENNTNTQVVGINHQAEGSLVAQSIHITQRYQDNFRNLKFMLNGGIQEFINEICQGYIFSLLTFHLRIIWI